MDSLILRSDQIPVVVGVTGVVPVCDPQGHVLGYFTPTAIQEANFTPEEIEIAKRRLAERGPVLSSEQVRARLKALEDA